MHFSYVLLAVTTILVATTQASVFDDNPDIVKFNAAAGERQVQRFLRKHNIADDEERGIGEKLKGLIPTKGSEKTLQRWADNNKAPKDALNRLNLGNAGTKLFEKSKFGKWVDYMKKVDEKNPEGPMLAILMTKYSDDTLSKMIIAAKKVDNTKDIATKLQAEQLRVWGIQGKSADDVLGLLQLKTKGTLPNLRESPQFHSWLLYVRGGKNPEETIVSTLSKYYNKDAVIKMFKKKPSTQQSTTKILGGESQAWTDMRISADKAFNTLSISKEAGKLDDIVRNPQFTSWTKQVDELTANDPKKTNALLVSTLTTYYTDEGLFKMLNSAKNGESTSKLATDLQKAQIDNWLVAKTDTSDVSRYMGVKAAKLGSAEKISLTKLFHDYRGAYNNMYINKAT
ncbi:Avirulence (Avh) protein [Phytophthora megakarya]|uniref:RxLR effector protein n=1 Tax=Phytophthora megakarya TaxID=4795 RepID=A0A225X622_9STRA|nr:Avirulence (Avh) protein [Phytophthora megakarya]